MEGTVAARGFWREWTATPFRFRFDSVARWRGILIAYVLFVLVVGVYYVGVKGEKRSAINRWRPAVSDMWSGTDIYLAYGFPTPPVVPILLTPFCGLDGKWTMASWFAFKAACTGVVLLWMLRVGEQISGGMASTAGWVALLLAARPIMGDLLHGNINLWILFVVMAAVMAFASRRDVLAGILLGLAIACKLTPALLGLYFLWKREWKVVASTVLGLLLWLVVVPGSLLGWNRNMVLLEHWADYMVWPYAADGVVETEQTNQSAAGLVHRLLGGPIEDLPVWKQDMVQVSVASIDPVVVGWIWKGIAAGLLAGLGWACWGRISDRAGVRFWHEICLVLLVMLLVSERSWKHHYVWLLPVGMVLSATAIRIVGSGGDRWRARWIWGCLGAAFVLMLVTSPEVVSPVFGDGSEKIVQAWGAYVWAAVALISAHVVVLFAREGPANQSL